MRNIFLIGFMGCGKSAVSCHMSTAYDFEVVEMDEILAKQEGMSIPEIFASKGEAYFREMETRLLMELQSKENKIVSCGGGAVLKEENVMAMKKHGIVILLTAEPETILKRVKNDDNRPLLRGNKNTSFIEEILEKRRPKYEAAADYVIQTDNKKIEDICKEIFEKIKE